MLERSYFKILFFYSFHYKSCTCKKRRKLKISPQPHTFIMHTHFDSLHINSLRETAWNCCMHNKCMEFYGSFTKDKNNNNKKKNLVPKTTSLFLTKLYPLVTEKVAWHLSYIFLSQHTRNMHIGSFFFRPLPFSWRLNRVQRKKFKLGLTTLFNNKIFYKIRLSLSRELQYLPFHFFTVYTPLICPPSLNFCLELSCMLHVLW